MDPLLQSELAGLLPPGAVHFGDGGTLDPAAFAAYGVDRTRGLGGPFAAVAFAESTEEVARLVRWAAGRGVPLVPSGGRTGYSGGAVARAGEVVVSLERMGRCLRFDPYLPALTVEAGMATAEVQRLAAERGLWFPVDFAAVGQSQVGGNVATNAGGIRVLRYGSFRDWVAGLRVVAGTGEVLELGGAVLKSNAGPDFKHLVIGSEGILGIVTEATLRLTSPPGPGAVALLGVSGPAAVLEALAAARQAGLALLACEFFDAVCVREVRARLGLSEPLAAPHPAYGLLEIELRGTEDNAAFEGVLSSLTESGTVAEVRRAAEPEERDFLWRYRLAISESLALAHDVHKNDLSVPIAALAALVRSVPAWLAGMPGVEAALFGHVGDGNLHLNLLRPEPMPPEEFRRLCRRFDERSYALVRDLGGSISAEHGIGLLKREHLHFVRSAEEIALLRAVKRAFDPAGILNPGKVLPEETP